MIPYRLVVVAVGALGALAGCRTPTQVTVELTTDVDCSDDPSTNVQVGSPGANLDDRPPSLATTACSAGRIGSFVVTPSGENDDEFALKVVLARKGRSFGECRKAEIAGSDFANCIVARRVTKFIPHTELTLPIALRLDCDGVQCPPTMTCAHGSCAPAGTMEPPGSSIDASSDTLPDIASPQDVAQDVALQDVSDGGDSGRKPDAAADADANSEVSDAGDASSVLMVQGKVIDYWRHPVSGATVYVGVKTATTDDRGAFKFEGVTKPYDVGIALPHASFSTFFSADAWLYRGLTRPNPTLQVEIGAPYKANNARFFVDNLPPLPTDDAGQPVIRWLGIGFGSPDAFFLSPTYWPTGSYIDYIPEWSGVSSTAGQVHALLWEVLPDDQVPTRYVAFDEHALVLDDAPAPRAEATFDLTEKALPTAKITGAVASASGAKVEVDAFLRFDDGAFIQIASMPSSPRTFEVLVPVIPATTITLSALIGSSGTPFGLAHVDGIASSEPTTVQLNVPLPVAQVLPDRGDTGITPATVFQWNAAPAVSLLFVSCPGPTRDDPHTRFFVVTEDYKSALPALGGASGIPLPSNRQCTWSVYVHGAYPTVDALTGAPAWLDPFSYYPTQLWGRSQGSGSLTNSGLRYLTTAP